MASLGYRRRARSPRAYCIPYLVGGRKRKEGCTVMIREQSWAALERRIIREVNSALEFVDVRLQPVLQEFTRFGQYRCSAHLACHIPQSTSPLSYVKLTKS